MTVARYAVRAALLVVVVAVLLIALDSGGSKYTVKFKLSNALGLRNGSKVVEGGVQVGSVSVALDHSGNVVATATIDKQFAPLGKNVTAQITALNLLGEKSLQLNPGNRSNALASGVTLPPGRVTPGTDLDQVLDVLDPTTADRLTILVNEAGEAVAGRRNDISAILAEVPVTAPAATALVNELASNNNQLSDLVARTDHVITAVNDKRAQLGDLINTFGQSSKTIEARDADLQATLQELPGTLDTAQTFLAKLKNTTGPLGPAAVDISDVAPGLQSVLHQLAPFTRAATPTLAKAAAVAPELTELGNRATPVLKVAEPTLASLNTASTDLKPVSAALNGSVDNIIATMWNWTHAIEERDALSHVFRAEVGVSADTVKEVVNRLLAYKNTQSTPSSKPSQSTASTSGSGSSASPVTSTVNKVGSGVTGTFNGLTGTISKTLNGVSKTLGNVAAGVSTTASNVGSGLSGTLHNLKGAVNGHKKKATTSTNSTQQLTALLKYLL